MSHTRFLFILLLGSAIASATPAAQGPGPGGPGGPNQPERKLVDQFDADKNGWLNTTERAAARAFLAANPAPGGRMAGPGGPGGPPMFGGPGGRGGRGGRGGPGGAMAPAGPAPKGAALSPADVPAASTPLYDDATLRTIFLTFEADDWEAELAAFHNTDVEVPATMVVDGRTYRDVGVHFRGASSYFMVPAGYKRSLNLAVDLAHADQHLLGYRTLNLNNANGDPSLMRAVLYEHIARQYVPTPSANFVRVVINGEYWGVYTNVAQFNKDFLRDHFKTDEGARWKAPGSPNGRAGLEYLGDDVDAYKRLYEIKTKDTTASWTALVTLTRVLNTTPPERREAALAPILDVDGALKFLAVENALVNTDGYWTRASDYNLYLAPDGRFHILPHDINEAMMAGGGPPMMGLPGRGGRGGGPGRGGPTLDPLVAAGDASKPLLSKLLAVPALRERYLGYVKDIATRHLDWAVLGPVAERYRALIADAVAADVKKLSTNEAFDASIEGLKQFAEARRAALLSGVR